MLFDTNRRKVEENSTVGGVIRSTPLIVKPLPVQKSQRKMGRVPHTCDLVVEDKVYVGSLWKAERERWDKEKGAGEEGL